jgi:hypothetical protein
MPTRFARLFVALLLAGCAVNDSRIAQSARTRLLGLSEVDLESCLGAPDQHGSFGGTDILTYYTTSSSNITYSIPVIGGIGLNNGGNCHATFQLRQGRVTQILYSGEKNATLAADAYCAPIFRTCLEHLGRISSAPPKQPTDRVLPDSRKPTLPQPSSATATAATPSSTED